MQKETVLFHFETLYFEIETYNSQNQEVQLENDFGKETTLLSLFNFRLTKTTFQQFLSQITDNQLLFINNENELKKHHKF